jgi:hypothetical protein
MCVAKQHIDVERAKYRGCDGFDEEEINSRRGEL